MNHHENLKILAFVGDKISIDSLIKYLTEKGYPKVTNNDIVSQIKHLSDAGQHRIISDEIQDFQLYKEIHHAFPGSLGLVGITTKEESENYREQQDGGPENWIQMEKTHHTDLIPLADHYFFTDGDEDLFHQVDALIEGVDFRL